MGISPIHLEKVEANFPFPRVRIMAVQTIGAEKVVHLFGKLANFRQSSGKTQKQLWVEVSCENQDWVTVSVTDTGDGIPNDALERIFEPFYTTKEVGVGTGLGLSVSYGIVHDMEGEMLAENTANGARISLKLPIIKA